MRITRISAASVALVAAAALVAGCSSDSSESGDAAGGKKVYALLPQGTDQPYGTEYLKAMQSEAEKQRHRPDHHQLPVRRGPAGQ